MNIAKFTFFCLLVLALTSGAKKKGRKTCKEKAEKKLDNSITLKIKLDKTVEIPLAKSNIVEDNEVQGLNDTKKGFVEQVPNSYFGNYVNVDMQASFTVMFSCEGSKPRMQYYGEFQFEDDEYEVYPEDMNKLSKQKIEPAFTYVQRKIKYLVFKNVPAYTADNNEDQDNTINDEINQKPTNDEPVIQGNNTNSITELEGRIAKQMSGDVMVYTVEIFCYIDYVIFKRWLSYSKNDKRRAIQHIRFYYSHAVNGVNDQYKTIRQKGFAIVFKIAGFFVADKQRHSAFVTDLSFDGVNLEGEQGLTAFREYVKSKGGSEKGFPRYDVIVLFTGLDMGSTQGIAYLSAVCTIGGVGIVKDLGHFSFIQTIAHEVGHSLGVEHDGEGDLGKNCREEDQFIMAAVSTEVTGQKLINSHTFSMCSVKYMIRHLNKMTKENRNCLMNPANHADPNTDDFLREFPGQKYGIDFQCKTLYGPNSKFCFNGPQSLIDACENMFCDVGNGRCLKKGNQRALPGTTCSNGAWCRHFRCVVKKY